MWPFNRGWPLNGGPLNRGSTVHCIWFGEVVRTYNTRFNVDTSINYFIIKGSRIFCERKINRYSYEDHWRVCI
jgi:hypothetical protein